MSWLDHLFLVAAGMVGGVINSVASGGSFFTYPAMLATGLAPIQAATSTLAALTPANLAAVPEYWPEVLGRRDRYPALVATVSVGGSIGIVLLFATGGDGFERLAPWLVLAATLFFAATPMVHRWAITNARSLTHGGVGVGVIFALSIYLTYFGSGVGNLFLAMLTIRGFGTFLSVNAAKNIVLALGTTMATVAYTVAGYVQWEPVLPVMIGSAIGARVASKVARRLSMRWLQGFVIAFGLFVAVWLFLR